MTSNQEAKAIFNALRALSRIEKPSERVKEICRELKACLPKLGYKAQRDPVTKDFVLIVSGLAKVGGQPSRPPYQRITGFPNAATNIAAAPRKVPSGNS